MSLPSEPCYWCGVRIENPDSWPCCHRSECQVQTMRWFMNKLGHVPERPELRKDVLLSPQVMQFLSTLGRPGEGGIIDWVLPPAARKRPLSIAPGDKSRFAVWCLEVYAGGKPEGLPKYLEFQIKRRIERSRLAPDMKRQIQEKEKEEKVKKILRKDWLKGL